MLRTAALVFVLLLSGFAVGLAGPRAASAQDTGERASLSGFVRDVTSGETLLLANVVLAGTTFGAATNNAGYYTLTGVPAGTYTVVASYLGYDELRREVTLAPGEERRLDLALRPADVEVGEVEVTADRIDDEEARAIGAAQLSTQAVRDLPTVFEPDVFRSLQLLPGVKAASDFSSGLYIRGGSPDQTLVLLDRNTVYNPSHFFGFFSPFNPDAIKDVRLYKGGYPAPYGGRLGAVVDIYNKDGNRERLAGGASVGLLASRAYVEGPYSKGSWMLAVRRSTLEPLFGALRSADVEGIPDAYYFYDVNAKVNLDAGPNDRLSLSAYTGADELDLPFLDDLRFTLSVGNRTLSGNWTHLFSPRLFSNFTVTSSRYFSRPEASFSGTTFSRDNDIYDSSVKASFEYVPGERYALAAGFSGGSFVMRLRDEFDGQEGIATRIATRYGSAYVDGTYTPTSLVRLRGGVRAAYFDQGGYTRLEPRLSAEVRPSSRLRLQLGYGRYYQFLTLITSELFSAFDVWLTTDEGVPPSHGDQFVAGVKTYVTDGVTLDVEAYYRTMRGLFELDPRLPDVAGLEYGEIFRFGEGYAWGTEVFLQKATGRLNGFAGYTFGRTRRRYPDFPSYGDFAFYPPKYDRTHDANVVLNVDLTPRWRLTGVFTYGTGQAYTEPTGQFRTSDDPFSGDVRAVWTSPRFNAARLPSYHRLDLGVTRAGPLFGGRYELQVQVINAYNRRNIWFYYLEPQDDLTVERTEVPQIPVPIPNLSFSVRF